MARPGTPAAAERSGAALLPHLLALQKMHPELRLTLSLDDRIADLVAEGVDVALRLSSEPPPGSAARVLARIETALFAAPGFKTVHAVSELAAHPHVRFSGIAQDAPLRLVSGDKTVDVKVNTVFRANTSEALLQALESGIGIGGCSCPSRPTLCIPGGWYRYYPPGDYPIAFSMRSILTLALSHRG